METMFKTGNAGKKTLSIVIAALLCCCVACSAAKGTKGMDADAANQQNQIGQTNQQGQLNQQDQSSQPDQTTQAGQTTQASQITQAGQTTQPDQTTQAEQSDQTTPSDQPDQVSQPQADTDTVYVSPDALTHDGYTLDRVVVLSRHNIRSPLIGKNQGAGKLTPHEWFAWTSPTSQLSVRGGVLETCMGQYFRIWLEREGLFPENYRPEEGEVRIYANSRQRTIATARFFSAGLLPAFNSEVEYHEQFDETDPVFSNRLTFFSETYQQAALQQIDEMYSDEITRLEDNYRLLEDVLDIRDSEAWKEGAVGEFRTDDTTVILEAGKDPAVEGSIKTASVLSDALMLQYYEEDPVEAAFGKMLSTEQWCDIAGIKDVYHGILLFTPLVARNAANPLLKEILGEMTCDERKFTFLCGHDLNLCSVLASLEVEPYELPSGIEKRTPIGGKLVFSRWCNESGEAFWDVDLVYQTPEQLREADILTWDHSPAIYDLSFREIGQNADGLYPEKVLFDRFEFAISAYDSIVETYR